MKVQEKQFQDSKIPKGYKQTEVSVIPEDWVVRNFNFIFEVIDGDRGAHYPNSEELRLFGDCLFLSAKNVTKKGFLFSECYFISKEKDSLMNNGKLIRGDFILTTRGTLGNVAFYNELIIYNSIRINSGMVILRLFEQIFFHKFIYQFLTSNEFHKQVSKQSFGSAQPQLTIRDINIFSIPLPPTLAEQEKIAEVLSDMDAEIEKIKAKIEKYKYIKKGMMQKLLTGQLRLV